MAPGPEAELEDLLQMVGDNIIVLFSQLLAGDWVDNKGMPVTHNPAMMDMQNTMRAIMVYRTKHMGYNLPDGMKG